jgi:hypothetical protein
MQSKMLSIFLCAASVRSCRGLVIGLLLLTILGCGPSQEDMMRRAASRSRDPDPEEVEAAAAPAPAPEVANAQPAVAPAAEAAATAANAPAATPPPEAKFAIKPISERKPEKPLSDIERRKRALSNLEKISTALLSYYKKSGSMPAAWLESSGGIKTLSWRVALLPELGYPDLYKQFNPEEPWDGPNNKKLLDLIPDEFVSPERFDTKTNFQLPVYGGYMFGRPGFAFTSDTDAAVNTLMLLEVNDSNAVPWTQPADYGEARENVKRGLGGLRGDGTFAVWANGMPVLVSNSVGWMEFHNALSAEAGDGQRAGLIHRSITIDEVTDASVVADSAAQPSASLSASIAPPAPEVVIVRDPVPDEILIAAAGKRLREVFAKKLAEANNDEKRVSLAIELLAESDNMTSDTASVFVMHGASMKLASLAGNIDLFLNCVDARVTRFDIDAYATNIDALTEFGTDNANRDGVDGAIYLKRAIPTIFAAIRKDDYVRASTIARYAFKFSDQPRNAFIPRSLNLLRTHLSTAQRHFEVAKDSLAEYRIDADDVDAASTFGRFLVFIKGDWEDGLPLLVRGGSEELRELAQADIRGAVKAEDMVVLGDAWWSMSDRAKTGVYRQACRDRASYWYSKAFAMLPESLDKIHVRGRLEEASGEGKASPLAIIRDLAEKTSVDLTISLASIADAGRRNLSDNVINEE